MSADKPEANTPGVDIAKGNEDNVEQKERETTQTEDKQQEAGEKSADRQLAETYLAYLQEKAAEQAQAEEAEQAQKEDDENSEIDESTDDTGTIIDFVDTRYDTLLEQFPWDAERLTEAKAGEMAEEVAEIIKQYEAHTQDLQDTISSLEEQLKSWEVDDADTNERHLDVARDEQLTLAEWAQKDRSNGGIGQALTGQPDALNGLDVRFSLEELEEHPDVVADKIQETIEEIDTLVEEVNEQKGDSIVKKVIDRIRGTEQAVDTNTAQELEKQNRVLRAVLKRLPRTAKNYQARNERMVSDRVHQETSKDVIKSQIAEQQQELRRLEAMRPSEQ